MTTRRSVGVQAVLQPAAVGLLAVLGTLVLVAVVPMLAGWRTTVVASGSMEPAMRPGDVLISRPATAADLVPGQVLLSDEPGRPGRLLTHRVVKILPGRSVTTKGDANAVGDSTPIRPDQVHGTGRVLVPRIGLPVLWMRQRNPRVLVFLVLTVAAAMLATSPTPRGPQTARTTPTSAPAAAAAGPPVENAAPS